MFFEFGQNYKQYARIMLERRPAAKANIKGSAVYKNLHGTAYFYPVSGGVLVATEVFGLPVQPDAGGAFGVFGYHIHAGNHCSGTAEDPFADTRGHFNPGETLHPYHAGDMPPLFGNDGYAYSAFVTDRFTIEDILGRTVIIHDHPDDFKTQPSGDSGKKIACGEIRRV